MIQFRVSDEERVEIERNAAAAQVGLSEWVRERALSTEGTLGLRFDRAVEKASGEASPLRDGRDGSAAKEPQGSGDGLAARSTPASPRPPGFRCPAPDCGFAPLSPAAVCSVHGRRVVPA